MAEQRYLIWRKCEGRSEAWQAEQQRLRDEANRKLSVAAVGRVDCEARAGEV